MVGRQLLEFGAQHLQQALAQTFAGQDTGTLSVDNFPLLVEHVVKVQQVLAHIEVVTLNLHLCAVDGLGDDLVLQRFVILEASPTHHILDAIAAEALHQLVFERDEELAAAGVALTAGATTQLVVHAPCFVVLGANDGAGRPN